MTDPGGADRVKYGSQAVLCQVYDDVLKALRTTLTIEGLEIDIGAVQISDPDNFLQKAAVDSDQRLSTRSLLQVAGSDVAMGNPVPATLIDEALGYDSDADLWQMNLAGEDLELMLWIEAIYDLLDSMELSLEKIAPVSGWESYDQDSHPLPAAPGVREWEAGPYHSILLTNEEPEESIEYSFNNGGSWAVLKAGEVRELSGVYVSKVMVRSQTAGGEEYRLELTHGGS